MNYLKPEILMHPHIPKPLHGLNPRTLMGKEWWDKTRYEAQRRTNYTCAACGVEKHNAKKFQWLEGHEYYNIDYKNGIVEIKSIEPLCHYCHNFIHTGRLNMIMGKDKTEEEVKDILSHGFSVLANNNLQCFPFTYTFARRLGVDTMGVTPYEMPESSVSWQDWKLIFEGKEYHSNFDSYEDWANHFSR